MIAGLGLLLVSGMGIVCGWQPMPDGDASYECVIQLEPELVSTLENGGSIPLSVDVPDHVRPIKRVRIIVGSGQVPQQSLVANLKPSSGDTQKKSREGIVELQYTYPNNAGDNRYATQTGGTQPILPPGGDQVSAQEAFARSLQNGGQAVRDAASQATRDILPPETGRRLSDAVDRTSQQLGSEIRNVGDSVNSNIRQLFGGESSNSITPPQGDSQETQILPPTENNASNTSPSRSRLSDEQSPRTTQAQDWQSRGSAASPFVAGGNESQSSNGNPNFDQRSNRTMQPGASPSTFSRDSSVVPQIDRYGNTIQPPPRSGVEIADNRGGVPAADQSPESGPGFPPFNPSTSGDLGLGSTTKSVSQNQANVPEIRRNMLDKPANADVLEANSHATAQQNPSNAPQSSNQNTSPSTAFDWNTQAQSPQQPAGQNDTNPAPVFSLLLSWVLLSGSGAGNLYLFWSYLDIRNKYRDVIYDVSHKITGRGGRD